MMAIGVVGVASLAVAAVEPLVMSETIFDALAKGCNDLSQSKFNEAQKEFENIIKADFDNPYANNNMAVLMEKQGKFADAMTYLNIGAKLAENYVYKVDTVYLIGGVTAAVIPEKTTTEKSPIAKVIDENQRKLAEKMGSKPADTSKNPGP
jgi:tetratricopeptide (TPR) repeat protein